MRDTSRNSSRVARKSERGRRTLAAILRGSSSSRPNAAIEDVAPMISPRGVVPAWTCGWAAVGRRPLGADDLRRRHDDGLDASLRDHPAVRETVNVATELQGRVAQLVNAYRVRGHLFANVDPLGTTPEVHPELELANFGLTTEDLTKSFSTAGMSGLPSRATLAQIVEHLSETYCSSIESSLRISASRTASVVARAHGNDAQPRVARSYRARAHPHEAHRSRDLRAVHPQELCRGARFSAEEPKA